MGSENVPLYDMLMRSPASRASIKVYCGLNDIAPEAAVRASV